MAFGERGVRHRAISRFAQTNPMDQVTGGRPKARRPQVPGVPVQPTFPGAGGAFGGNGGSPKPRRPPGNPFGANPAPPPPPGPGDPGYQMPPDPAYDQTIGGLTGTRDNTLAGLGQQRTAGLLDYGYNATYDDQGNATGLTFDPNNPNSRAAQLKQRYQEQKGSTSGSYAARGQAFSGAFLSAQNQNADHYQTADDAMQKAVLGFLGRIHTGELGAKTAFETGSGQAEGDRVGRIPSNPLENPATAPAGSSSPSAAAPVTGGGVNGPRHNGRVAAGSHRLHHGKSKGKAKR